MKFKKNFISILEHFPVHCDSVEQVRLLRLRSEIRGIYIGLTKNVLSDSSYYGIYEGQLLCGRRDFFILRGYGAPLEFDELLEPEEGQENDIISHPAHYCHGKYEPKDVIRDWGLNFNLGNVVKYISRAGYKDDIVQDLKKARQYLDFEIEALEAERK